jgi:hypothetical protein
MSNHMSLIDFSLSPFILQENKNNNDAIKFKQMKIELIQCKAELDLIKKISLHESIRPVNKDFSTSKIQHTFAGKMVQMIDNEI